MYLPAIHLCNQNNRHGDASAKEKVKNWNYVFDRKGCVTPLLDLPQ